MIGGSNDPVTSVVSVLSGRSLLPALISSLGRGQREMIDPGGGGGITPIFASCPLNCSGHGECTGDGKCLCEVWFTGGKCSEINSAYLVSFTSFFYLVGAVTIAQLVFRISYDYMHSIKTSGERRDWRSRLIGSRSTSGPFNVTNQKLLYALIIIAAGIRGTYFVSKGMIPSHWSAQLLSAYYPVIITCFSVLVCSWGEMFHMSDIPSEEPRFLGKSRLAFVVFNAILYTLLLLQTTLVAFVPDNLGEAERIIGKFNACFAGLMLILLVTFLVYGVELFFKVQGAFTSALHSPYSSESNLLAVVTATPPTHPHDSAPMTPAAYSKVSVGELVTPGVHRASYRSHSLPCQSMGGEKAPLIPGGLGQLPSVVPGGLGPPTGVMERRDCTVSAVRRAPRVNDNQVAMSRLGLVSQGLLQLAGVLLLSMDSAKDLWVDKVPVSGLNLYNIVSRVVEFGIIVWFPCVLWDCKSPGNLWVLNPRKLLLPRRKSSSSGSRRSLNSKNYSTFNNEKEEAGIAGECYICYDGKESIRGGLIRPCLCSGDVSTVHHDCLKRWLLENQRSSIPKGAFHCSVCKEQYSVRWGWVPLKAYVSRPSILLSVSLLCVLTAFPVGVYYSCIAVLGQTYLMLVIVGVAAITELLLLRMFAIVVKKQMEELALDGLVILTRQKLVQPLSQSL